MPYFEERHLHVRRAARERYGIDDSFFTYRGCLSFPEFHQARDLAFRINTIRKGSSSPALTAGHLYAAGLIHEIQHHIVNAYETEAGKEIFGGLEARLKRGNPAGAVPTMTKAFVREFAPPRDPAPGTDPRAAAGTARNRRAVLIEEILLLRIANENPALAEFSEFLSDGELRRFPAYASLLDETETYLSGMKRFGKDQASLLSFLLAPIKAHPDSLSDQLSFIAREWRDYLGDYLQRILVNLDLIKEEEKGRGGGPGPARPWDIESLDFEYESYSLDTHWMPNVVLIAKSVHVWLWQLSRRYGREIARLDQIPDEELDLLKHRGFTGLWLIGLWERSPASKTIKRSCGNPEAAASAYSVFRYEIAWDLGGWDALYNLRHRCMERGIRLASDMVPNHTGIDSEWIHDHPDWFIQSDRPPFPGYSFSGQNLSSRAGVEVILEDHYYDRTDAAVVFKRVDSASGAIRYIYHGNDGTHMPWNDTAQLNFLLPEVRDAVIGTILHVARNFPIIRFDAAMTLARKHFQRLWFPEPGTGGDIPSRSEYGITASAFKELMPNEFWREVVDTVGREAPDTLLLAEAFWLMESYFVRTLGMHRVYNSAFMHMLKNEDNKTYRDSMKKTLEFDPEILKRFVNFMNNPDEETAVSQFGKGDKYFGVCVLMVTLPGLPMFGHGQVEGFSEKYGMEYTRAYRDETPEQWFVDRHEAEIFPLIKRRYLFGEVENFLLFDFHTLPHMINENVYAFLNGFGKERALVFYNNKFDRASGWIREAVPISARSADGGKELVTRHLHEGLGVSGSPGRFIIFREQKPALWYIRSSADIARNGLSLTLDGYESRVFLDFHEVEDPNGYYGLIAERLAGKGTSDISFMFKETLYHSIHECVESLYAMDLPRTIRGLMSGDTGGAKTPGLGAKNPEAGKRAPEADGLPAEAAMVSAYTRFLEEARVASEGMENLKPLIRLFTRRYRFLTALLEKRFSRSDDPWKIFCSNRFTDSPLWPEVMEGFLFFGDLHLVITDLLPGTSVTLLREWGIDEKIRRILAARGRSRQDADAVFSSLSMMISHKHWYLGGELYGHDLAETIGHLFSDPETRAFLRINIYQGTRWFNKERFEELVWFLFAGALFDRSPAKRSETDRFGITLFDTAKTLLQTSESAGYRVDSLLGEIEKETAPPETGEAAGKPD